MTVRPRLRRLAPAACLVVALALPAACGGSAKTPAPAATSSPSSPPPGTVSILVTNDDGVDAPGISALVERLRRLPGVDVQVVAPARNQSGSGGKTTPGALPQHPATTSSGYRATAVEGYPADTVRVALDDLHLKPTLVVAGVNAGQNTGPLVAISGTVGAARAAARRGIPALAVSQGQPGAGGTFDFEAGADQAARQVQSLLPTLAAGGATTSTVENLNVPSCGAGTVRGLLMLPPEVNAAGKPLLEPSDCTSTARPADEITAFHDGFAVLTRVSATP